MLDHCRVDTYLISLMAEILMHCGDLYASPLVTPLSFSVLLWTDRHTRTDGAITIPASSWLADP